MASLLVADELSDVTTQLDGVSDSDRRRDEEALTSNVDTLAERIEHIAQRLEQS
jgi:cell division protein ZapA (FtsZ GTPase activity inhibitor)